MNTLAKPSGMSMERKLIVCAILSTIFLAEKQLAAIFFIPASTDITHLSFGFGGYIDGIINSGQFQSCNDISCSQVSRMPGLPLFVSALSVFSQDQQAVALIKNAIVSLLFIVLLGSVYLTSGRYRNAVLMTVMATLPIMIFSPAIVKHASALTYEEGFILEFLPIWLIASLLALTAMIYRDSGVALDKMSAISILLASFLFAFKASMIPLLILSSILGGLSVATNLKSRAMPRYTMASAILLTGMLALWGQHHVRSTGQLSIMTSWDGENLFRGANTQSVLLYPDTDLDRIFDSAIIVKTDGSIIPNTVMPSRDDFTTEAEWNDHYRNLARNWIESDSSRYIKFTATKARVFFLSVKKTPFKRGATNATDQRTLERLQDAAITVWMAFGRLSQFGLVVLVFAALARGGLAIPSTIATSLFCLAYASPYIVGFAYERHITPFLLMIYAGLVFNIFAYFFTCARDSSKRGPAVSRYISGQDIR